MLTFFEFYETLLGFVLYKLYGELGVRYPLPIVVATAKNENNGSSDNGKKAILCSSSAATLHPALGGRASSVLAANLSALQMALNDASKGNSAADAIKDALLQNDKAIDGALSGEEEKAETKIINKAGRKKQKKLMHSIDEALMGVDQDDESDEAGSDDEEDGMDQEDDSQVPIAAHLREALEAIDDSAASYDENINDNVITNPEARKRLQLFHNLTFFLSREVPRGYLELIILSYGGKVGWEGQDTPIAVEDGSITHHIVDRPKLLPGYSKLPKSREFIQPQWILDCANFNFLLPIKRYGVGMSLPPHLSPWVDDKEEGYVPKYKEEVEKLRNGEMLDDASDDELVPEVETASKGQEEDQGDVSSEEESEALSISELKQDIEVGDDESKDESESSEEEDDDDQEANLKAQKKMLSEVS